MDSTIIVAIVGALATVTAAVVGAWSVQEKKRKNDTLLDEIEHLKQNGYRVPMLSPEEYGVSIVTPADYSNVDHSFEVSGTYRTLLPGQRIWTSTFRVDSEGNVEYWPQGVAKHSDGKWYGKVHNIGGKSGENEEFLVMIVGPDGDALFRHFGKVGMITGNWTGISILTGDIVRCGKGIVRLK